MKTKLRRRTLTATSLTACLLLMAPGADAADIPDDAINRIEQALPDAPTVQPSEPRTILIFSLCKGYRHGSIPYGVHAFTRLGERTGAYTAIVSEDTAMFTRENLARFDAIIFNNSTGALFTDPQLKQNLIDFVKQGGGIVGIHAATDCFYDWPEYGEMMGAYFHGHPWHEQVTLKLDDADHPVNAVFQGEPFVITDEIYQFKEPYSRDRLHVLLSLDAAATDMEKDGIHRADGDFAVSWVRAYGKGRVFYCSLGHRNEIFWNPTVLQHYLDGIQFAIGDLPGDPFDAVTTYQFGESRLPLSEIAGQVRDALGDPEREREIEGRLIGLLSSDEATIACKMFACRQLALAGGDASVPVLADLLDDPQLAHMARYALERIPGKAVDTVLIQALHELDGELRIGVINSIGERGNRRAAKTLFKAAVGVDEPTRLAVVEAMGKLGGSQAVSALTRIAATSDANDAPRVKAAALDGLLRCAEIMVDEGETDRAAALYRTLYDEPNPQHVRVAALRGLVLADPLPVIDVVIGLLEDEDPAWRGTAARLIVEMPTAEATRLYATQLTDLQPSTQILLMNALADRGDRAAGPMVAALIDSADLAVTQAAVRALARIGDASHTALLAELAARGDAQARMSLDRLRAEGADEAIASLLYARAANVRREAARSLGSRAAVGQVSPLIRTASNDPDELARIAALRSLGLLAGQDALRDLVHLLLRADNPHLQAATSDCLIAVCTRIDDRAACATPIADAFDDADMPAKRSLLVVLGHVGGPVALDVVREAIDEPALADAALDALTNWSDVGAADDLFAIAQQATDPVQRITAFIGYIRVINLPSARDPVETVNMYRRAAGIATNDAEHRLVLTGLAGVPHTDALRLIEGYLSHESVSRDAASALLAIARLLGEQHRDVTQPAIDNILRLFPDDAELTYQAGHVVNDIERNEGFITTWRFAGPFAQENTGGEAIFDVAFAPETGDEVHWQAMPADAFSEPGIYNLNEVVVGSNCCAYLEAIIVSDREQQARLEVGSDDGVKVLLNGEVVHANSVMRGLSVGQDVFTVTLAPGRNVLLLKITQGGGGWQACCRIRAATGFALQGVTIESPR
ncbi:MAG: ThuA domain-containing protein [Phycisphaerales bacterium]|nr:ThuA domain-containing protein [Phycisphaerales bacterium]